MLREQLRNIVVTKQIHNRPFLFHTRGGSGLLGLRLGALLLSEIFLDAVNRVGRRGGRGEERII